MRRKDVFYFRKIATSLSCVLFVAHDHVGLEIAMQRGGGESGQAKAKVARLRDSVVCALW